MVFLAAVLSGCSSDRSLDISAPTEQENVSVPLDPATEEEAADSSTSTDGITTIKTFPFPSEYSYLGDVAYDSASDTVWTFAGDSNSLDTLLQIDLQDGSVLNSADNPSFFLNHGSEVAFDGEYLWATTYGSSNGESQSYIFKLDTSGNILEQIPCPSTDTGGYCEGLAWDGQYLWTGASDNKSLVRYDPSTGETTAYENFWDTIGYGIDIGYDFVSGQLLVKKDGKFIYIDSQSVEILYEERYDGSISKGDWTGELFWFADTWKLMMTNVLLDPATE